MRDVTRAHAAPAINRRSVLVATTAAMAAAGAVAAAWPFFDQMNPDGRERAAADIVDIDLMALQPAERRVLRWRNFPVFVVRRTPAMLATMQARDLAGKLVDPDSQRRQQPSYAKNWHRSIDPAFAVLVGVCTQCAVIPTYCSNDPPICMAGGYACPFCTSRYDPAGRAYSGNTQYNLPVPPHTIVGQSKILLGKNPPGELFSFDAIERV